MARNAVVELGESWDAHILYKVRCVACGQNLVSVGVFLRDGRLRITAFFSPGWQRNAVGLYRYTNYPRKNIWLDLHDLPGYSHYRRKFEYSRLEETEFPLDIKCGGKIQTDFRFVPCREVNTLELSTIVRLALALHGPSPADLLEHLTKEEARREERYATLERM